VRETEGRETAEGSRCSEGPSPGTLPDSRPESGWGAGVGAGGVGAATPSHPP
jgi:hypothetical protein